MKVNILKLVVTFFLTIMLAFFIKIYFDKKSENIALKIKTQLMDKNKKTAKILNALPLKQNGKPQKESKNSEVKTNQDSIELVPSSKVSEYEPDYLFSELKNNLIDLDKLSVESVAKNLELADELISKEPNSYSAYKAKLILLILSESKFGQEIDDYELNFLLESMAQFDMASDQRVMEEAILIATKNSRILELEDKLMKLDNEEASNQIQIEIIKDQLAKIENEVVSELNYVNEDVVHIPFLRLLSKGENEEVIYYATDFLNQFPDSVYARFYLIKALELSERKDEIVKFLNDSSLSKESLVELQLLMKKAQNQNYKEYWKTLKF